MEDMLPESVLIKRTTLPLKPDPVILTGKIVRLEPFDIELHSEILFSLSNGSAIDLGDKHCDPYDANELIWKYLLNGPFNSLEEFKEGYKKAFEINDVRYFVVIDLKTETPVGVCSIMRSNPNYLTVEIGHIWLSPIAQKTGASHELSLLLIDHIFQIGYRRCEWKCNAKNNRSRQAALKIGFVFEGIQEFHMITKNKSRDTAWFRILCHEWEGVRERLTEKLYSTY